MQRQDVSAVTVRTMTLPELETAIDWAAGEGWNPGLNDAACFYAADPQGFLVGELDGEPIACISAIRYDDRFGFGGFYIARPDMRGHGFGLKMWRAASRRLAGLTVGLDGVVEQQENYKRSGFIVAYRHLRYEGIGGGTPPDGVTLLTDVPFEALLSYDRQLFPAPRPDFLRAWIEQPGGTALGMIAGDTLIGYGVLRPCRTGFKIGPLFADSPQIAETLFRALAAHAPNAPIFLDIPEPNTAARDLVAAHNMNFVFETARMYANGEITVPLDREYGVTTLELG